MSCFFIGGSKQCGNIVLRNEQGTEDALCLGCDELLFARYKEQEVYLQNRNQNMYFRAPGSRSPDLHTVFKSRGHHLLYPRIEGAFLIDCFHFLALAAKDGPFSEQARGEHGGPGSQTVVFHHIILSSSDSSLSNQQTLLSGQNTLAKQQEESQKLGAELLSKVSTTKSDLDAFFVCRAFFV